MLVQLSATSSLFGIQDHNGVISLTLEECFILPLISVKTLKLLLEIIWEFWRGQGGEWSSSFTNKCTQCLQHIFLKHAQVKYHQYNFSL